LPQPSQRLITAGEKSDSFTDRLGLLLKVALKVAVDIFKTVGSFLQDEEDRELANARALCSTLVCDAFKTHEQRVTDSLIQIRADRIEKQAAHDASAAYALAMQRGIDSVTPAVTLTVTKATPTTALSMKVSALIAEFESEWPSVSGDIREAKRNGLKKAAHTGKHGMYDPVKARAWAVSMGKIKSDKHGHSLTSPWRGPVTRNKLSDK
jgi:hypothetical protein